MSPTRRPLLLPALLALLGLSACVLNNNAYPRPRDLSPGWRVDKLRLLAIQAEPPELAPGQTATLRALLIDPDDTVGTTVWVACDQEQSTDFGCPFDPSGLSQDLTPEQLAELGVIGVEPLFPPAYTATEDDLEGLNERERLEGVNLVVNALALPDQVQDTDSFDFNQVESGFKRLVVSQAETPNDNPILQGFTVDDVPVPPDTVTLVDPGQPYELSPVLPESSIQTYAYVNLDGQTEERVEEPFARWYATGGTMDEDVTLHPFLGATWLAPEEPGVEGTWWAVVEDRRGGLGWVSRTWRTRSE